MYSLTYFFEAIDEKRLTYKIEINLDPLLIARTDRAAAGTNADIYDYQQRRINHVKMNIRVAPSIEVFFHSLYTI